MMCSAKGFCSSKGLFYKAFSHFNASQSSLTHRNDGLIGAGNNPMVGMTVAVAVAIQEAADAGKF